MKVRGEVASVQPGTTWDTSFFEVVPAVGIDNQRVTFKWYGWDNLFLTPAYAREGTDVFRFSPQYEVSCQKVVPSVPPRCKSLTSYSESRDNLNLRSVPGCTSRDRKEEV